MATRFGSRIGVRQELVDGEILDVIDPGPNVGMVTLPSGRLLECSPKIEAANVFYMLSVAYELPDFLSERAAFDDLRHVFEFVVQHSADLTEDRIRHGLYRSYLERQDNLRRLQWTGFRGAGQESPGKTWTLCSVTSWAGLLSTAVGR